MSASLKGSARRLQLDSKWLARWATSQQRKEATKGKWYQLCMFPYPSGSLHIGHLRVYTISDVLARFRRMMGYDVLHPIGWDAFGLPAENAALERGISASTWTYNNIDLMRGQLERMLASFDWDRQVVTCDPEYYKHTQQIFLQLFKAGLCYRASAAVNWDPVEKTVLANEQVDATGRSWRSGALVERRELEQWFLKITDFANELENDMRLLPQWPDSVKSMQHNWLGISHGAEIDFGQGVVTFTTRPDTLGGVQFIALSLNHPLVKAQKEYDEQLRQFCDTCDVKSTAEGYRLKTHVRNPLNWQAIPVFAAPFVLEDYGTGAVMGVPGHDLRDNKFWSVHGTGEAIQVIDQDEVKPGEVHADKAGTLNEASGFPGVSPQEGASLIVEQLEQDGLARRVQKYRLRDWLISRQRFWGAPIPIVHCDSCGIVPVPEEELPIKLPADHAAPLSECEEFLATKCPSCGQAAKRDPDTMDTFMDSSWYYFRYTDPENSLKPFSSDKASSWLPVDMYVGGVEHAILHLLYSRFLSKFFASEGSWSGGDLRGEPFRRLVTQGMVHGKTFIDPSTGRFLKPEEVDNGTILATGEIAEASFEKMSKSKYNGADPLKVIDAHGADATRAHILFQAPVTDVLDWDETKIVGVERWLDKVDKLTNYISTQVVEKRPFAEPQPKDMSQWETVQSTVRSVSKSLESTLALNTVVSDMMKATNALAEIKNTSLAVPGLEVLLRMMAPVCPASAEENWETLLKVQGRSWESVHAQRWPEPTGITRASDHKINIMINGRKLLTHSSSSLDEATILEELAQIPEAASRMQRGVLRVVFRPEKKLLNVIVPK